MWSFDLKLTISLPLQPLDGLTDSVIRIEAFSFLIILQRLLDLSSFLQDLTHIEVSFIITWVYLDGLHELLLGCIYLFVEMIGYSQICTDLG